MLVIREHMIDLYSGFLKKLIYLLIHLQKKNCELKWLFMNSFLRVMIVMLFFRKILLMVQRDVKV